MRSDKELLAIQNHVVCEAEGCDFLFEGEFGLTQEEIDYIQSLGDQVKPPEQFNGTEPSPDKTVIEVQLFFRAPVYKMLAFADMSVQILAWQPNKRHA